jgi:endonuclease III
MKQLRRIVSELASHYGTPEPRLTDPLHLILWENIGYLVDDDKRRAGFERLRREVGLKPTDILAAPTEKLVEILKVGGIHPELRAQRLKEIAHIVLNDFEGNVRTVLKLPYSKAIKALRKFPSIGEPGAEKIMLFCKAFPVLALESNGLRVLLRLGFGKEQKNYSAAYRSVRDAVAPQASDGYDFLISAHQLLRLHGKRLCKNTAPHCDECPLTKHCNYYKARNEKPSTQILKVFS